MKRLLILGSTGSVGETALSLVEQQRSRFQVVGLAAGKNAARLRAQADSFDVPVVALADPEAARSLSADRGSRRVLSGPGALEALVRTVDCDLVVHAVTGAAGLPASVAALERGLPLALANKESLVIAGEFLMPLARRHGATLLPVDSEHSAIFQCVRFEPKAAIRRIYLTASGGPFRDRPLETFPSITRAEALKHPNWSMGERITIGSATMMNKAFEIVEAHHLFQLRTDQIRVLIHRQSVVHSMVEFEDGSMMAQLGVPDMCVPVQVALHHPERAPMGFEPFDLAKFSNLTFSEPEPQRFPCLALGRKCVELGGTSGAVLNAADEVATQRFLQGEILFPQIATLCEQALAAVPIRAASSLGAILDADAAARAFVHEAVAACAR